MELGFQQLDIKRLVPSTTNPRQIHDEKSLEDLAESIKTAGILEPLLARPKNGVVEVIAGARRLAAAKKAGLDQVPVIVRELNDVQVLEIQMIENLQRENVHPLDEAVGFRRLIDEAKMDVATIAEKIGKSLVYVYQRLQLAQLIAPAKKAFSDGTISIGHAILLARLPQKDQDEAFKECFERVYEGKGGKAVVAIHELKNWIARHCSFHLSGAPWAKEDKLLLLDAGACSTCTKRTGSNTYLFNDMKGSDICTDRTCFNRKMQAFLAKKEAQLKEKGTQVQRIATDWLSDQELKHLKAIGQSQFHKLRRKDRKCDHVVKGLVVSGNDRGQAYDICTAPKCDVHGNYISRHEDPKEKARRKAEEQKARLMSEVRELAIRRVLEQKKPLTGDDLAFIVCTFWEEIWHEHQKKLIARHGWNSDRIKKHVEAMKGLDLYQLLLEISLTCTADPQNYHHDQGNLPESFDAICARWGVDVKKVMKEIVAAKTKGEETK